MLKQLIKEHTTINDIRESANSVLLSTGSDELLTESQANLKEVIKKVLITNKVIPETLATVISRTILFSTMMEELINRKKRYKKHSLLTKVHDRITDVTALALQPATAEQVDNVNVDIISVAREVVAGLTGNSESLADIQFTFDAIMNRLTTATSEKNRLNVMKLSSLITQSNQDTRKRKDIIKQYL
jgi:hypothetical protein